MFYQCKQYDVLDDICHAHYGTTVNSVEMVLEANPGLADYGTHLPIGLKIELPEIAPPKNDSGSVNLWD